MIVFKCPSFTFVSLRFYDILSFSLLINGNTRHTQIRNFFFKHKRYNTPFFNPCNNIFTVLKRSWQGADNVLIYLYYYTMYIIIICKNSIGA